MRNLPHALFRTSCRLRSEPVRQNEHDILYGDALSLCDKRSGTKLFLRLRLKKQVPAFFDGPLYRTCRSWGRHRLSLYP